MGVGGKAVAVGTMIGAIVAVGSGDEGTIGVAAAQAAASKRKPIKTPNKNGLFNFDISTP